MFTGARKTQFDPGTYVWSPVKTWFKLNAMPKPNPILLNLTRVEGTWHSALAFGVTTYSPQCTTLHCVGKIRPAPRYIVITVYLSPKTLWLMGFKFFTTYLLIQKSWILIHFYRNLMEARTFITLLLSLLGKILLWWYNILFLPI